MPNLTAKGAGPPGLFGIVLPQTNDFAKSLLRLTGLDWAVPNFSTICRRQRTLAVNIPYPDAKCLLYLLLSLAPGSRFKGKASGTPANIAATNDASNARSSLV
ncbi:MAG: transposase [Gammaproteobacteria bacterium]|nr:transposase [Alphaproteobacteria bacterium]MBU1831940.1 transposase [Gammaproteobacteria bacterium]